MEMGRLPRGCGIGTYRFRYAPLIPPVRLGPPCRRPILIATKAMLFMGQDAESAGKDTFARASSLNVPKALLAVSCRQNSYCAEGCAGLPAIASATAGHSRVRREIKKYFTAPNAA
jgi:hypothetical protein